MLPQKRPKHPKLRDIQLPRPPRRKQQQHLRLLISFTLDTHPSTSTNSQRLTSLQRNPKRHQRLLKLPRLKDTLLQRHQRHLKLLTAHPRLQRHLKHPKLKVMELQRPLKHLMDHPKLQRHLKASTEKPQRPPSPKDSRDMNNLKPRECMFQHQKPITSHPLSSTRVFDHLFTCTRPQSLNMLQHPAMDLLLHLTMPVTLLRSQPTIVELDTLLKHQLMTPEPVTLLKHQLMTPEPVTLLKHQLMMPEPVTLLKHQLMTLEPVTRLRSNLTLPKSSLTPHRSQLTLLQFQLTTLDPVMLLKSNLMTQEPAMPLKHRLILTLDHSPTTPNSSHRLTMPVPAIQLLQLSHNKNKLQFTMPQQHQQLVVTQSRATSGRQ
jgi:hypothetical protein